MKKRNLYPELPANRGTGKSTAGVLTVLAKAIANPGVPQPFIDHFGTRQANQMAWNTASLIADRLGLKFMAFYASGNDFYVRFDLYEKEN